MTSLMGSPAFANDPPKKAAAKEEPPKPKFDYIEENGEVGRSGYIYKRVAKPKFGSHKKFLKLSPKKRISQNPKTTTAKKTMATARLKKKRKRTMATVPLLRKTKRRKTMAMVTLKRTPKKVVMVTAEVTAKPIKRPPPLL